MRVIKTILITLIASLLVIAAVRCGSGIDRGNDAHDLMHTPAETPVPGPTDTAEPALAPVADMPGIMAQSAILMDAKTRAVLWEKNGDMPMYPASTTKIMTALAAIDWIETGSVLRVGDEANKAGAGSSIAGLDYGEEISFENLLNALLLPSGNDAAYVLAVNAARIASGNRNMPIDEAVAFFVDMMNRKASELGAGQTHFTNPDGYHDEGHTTTAYDLALIAREAMESALFREVVSTEHVRIDDYRQFNENDTAYRDWYNTNELIRRGGSNYYEYATGIKTGHTESAGYCLAASASKGSDTVIAVVLGSTQEAVFADARILLEACFD